MAHTRRLFASSTKILQKKVDLLARPSWSVKSLLPKSQQETKDYMSIEMLNHLHDLSALPKPTTDKAAVLLEELRSLVHFVHHVKSIDVGDTRALTHIYPETSLDGDADIGVRTTSDSERLKEWNITSNHEKGLSLLKHATKSQGNWFVVDKKS